MLLDIQFVEQLRSDIAIRIEIVSVIERDELAIMIGSTSNLFVPISGFKPLLVI